MIVGVLAMMALAQAPAGPATVSGQVVDAEGRPVAGAEVVLSGFRRGTWQVAALALVMSDRDGRFRIDVPAETDTRLPHGYQALWAYAPKAGLAGQALAPEAPPKAGAVQLKLGAPAHTAVRVVGPDGKPVAGARVAPAWLRTIKERRPGTVLPTADALGDRLAALTDADGKGDIQGCRAEDIVAVRIEAAGFGSQLSELGAEAAGARPVKLLPAGRLNGRVQVDDPSAARGVEVIAVTRPRRSDGVWPLGRGRTMTDADGRFTIPELAAGALRLDILPPEGAKLKPKVPSELAIEPGRTIDVAIALEGPSRQRTVTGRAVDREGRPIAGAVVFQSGDSPTRTEATTGADGRFTLSGVIARPTFVFARKAGYRFGGVAIGSGPDEVTFTIHTTQEPPRLVRKTLPPPLPHEEDLALARRLLDPYAERALKQGGEGEKLRVLEPLARIEPERVLELIQQKKVSNIPFFNGLVGLQLAIGLMDESVDEALSVLEGLEDTMSKAIGFLRISRQLGARDRTRALEVLDRALLNARVAQGPDGIRLLLLGQVAEGFLDLGQADRGRALLREGEAIAKQLPKGGWVAYARGAFAEELVQIDPDAALALTKDLSNAFEFNRHHGNIAHELAGRDPARSEQVLAIVKDRNQRDQYTVRVVYRMAPLDLERARRLAGTISDDALKGYALGIMALRLIEAGKDSARLVLAGAYESLERSSRVNQEKSRSLYDITSIAAVLLPVAERIDPALVDEYLWRSLAMRQPEPWDTGPNDRGAYADVMLAMVLARYDRAIARSLVEPLARGVGSAPAYSSTTEGELPAAAAAIDPKWAVTLVEAMPDDSDLSIRSPKNAARLAVANVLGRAGEQRFRKLEKSFLNLWVPDIEDNDPYD
jgi:Carboxypeptidase regulatory-like domain